MKLLPSPVEPAQEVRGGLSSVIGSPLGFDSVNCEEMGVEGIHSFSRSGKGGVTLPTIGVIVGIQSIKQGYRGGCGRVGGLNIGVGGWLQPRLNGMFVSFTPCRTGYLRPCVKLNGFIY